MPYTVNPADPTRPLDSDEAMLGAAELRALKGYLQGLITGGGSFTSYAWQGFRNQAINGMFMLWQRATSLAAGTGTRYCADSWANVSLGSTIAASQQAFALGQTDVPGNPAYFHRCVVASVANVANFARLSQAFEDVTKSSGRTVISFLYAKADAPKDIAIEYTQNFGTGGAPSATVTSLGVQKITLSTAWQLFNLDPVVFPSVAGKTLGTLGDDSYQINFWMDAGANFNARTDNLGQQSGTFDFALVQVEFDFSTTFEFRPPQVERDLSYRHLEQSVEGTFVTQIGAHASGIQTTFLLHSPTVSYKVTKPRTPTITVFNTQNATGSQISEYDPGGVFVANRTGVVSNVGITSFYHGSNGTFTVGNHAKCHWRAEALPQVT